jgi:uncharacterized membrane protein YidH (DUF202 family)
MMRMQLPADPDAELAAGERTELAWSRSGLALLACFAILGRHVWSTGAESGDALAVALLALAALGWAIGMGAGVRRRRRVEPAPRSQSQLLAITVSTLAVAGAGVVIAFVNV